MQKIILPSSFKARYSKLLGNENSAFLKWCQMPLRKSIRVNTLKIEPKELIQRLEKKGYTFEEIPWTFNEKLGQFTGYWIKSRTAEGAIGNTDEHFIGYFYVQEASSMIPPIVLSPKEHETVLDVAAAPGSKTTQMSEMMHNSGMIIANDPNIQRLKALAFNIEKAGAVNVILARMDGNNFSKSRIEFDKILLDAPCSAEGTVRKDWKALSHWNENLIHSLSRLQKNLIVNVASRLKKGGTLVYSTCTLAPEENEEVVSFLLGKFQDFKIEPIRLKGLKTRHGVLEWNDKKYNPEVKNCARIYPQDNDSEGFFITKLVRA